MNTPLEAAIAKRVSALTDSVIPVRACAKVNLRLKVLGRRADGYHLLSMLNATVDLCDEIGVRFTPHRGVRLVVEPHGVLNEPPEQNLVVRAFNGFWRALGFDAAPIGLDCHITKKIPIGGGMGGGSSDAGAMLRVLSATFGELVCSQAGLSPQSLVNSVLEVASRCGADVPYSYFGGVAWVEGVGEIVHPLPLATPWPGLIAVMVPPEAVPTAPFYERYRSRYPHVPQSSDPLREQYAGAIPYDELSALIENDFEQDVTCVAPSVGQGVEISRRYFPRGTSVTGSGSAFFSVVPPGAEAKLTDMTRELARHDIRTIACRFAL